MILTERSQAEVRQKRGQVGSNLDCLESRLEGEYKATHNYAYIAPKADNLHGNLT